MSVAEYPLLHDLPLLRAHRPCVSQDLQSKSLQAHLRLGLVCVVFYFLAILCYFWAFRGWAFLDTCYFAIATLMTTGTLCPRSDYGPVHPLGACT